MLDPHSAGIARAFLQDGGQSKIKIDHIKKLPIVFIVG